MKILVGDVYCTIVNPRECMPAVALVKDICRARPEGYKYMPGYKSGRWDGYISLMDSPSRFPTGLLSYVVNKLEDSGYTVETETVYPLLGYIPVESNSLTGVVLRDYQIKAANVMLKSARGVAHMATNAGKTEVMAAVLKALDVKSIVLVHRKELLYQTAERFKARGLTDVGIIGDGIWQPGKITVAMIQTLLARVGDWTFNDNKVLMVDECHHLSADKTLDIVSRIPGSYRYGLSGTPLRDEKLSDMRLIAYTGRVIVKVSNKFLIEQGYSAKPIVSISVIELPEDIDGLDAEYVWELDYQDAYSRYVVNNAVRNAKIAEYAKTATGSVLILISILEHGYNLQKLIPDSEFVNGSHTTEYRRGIIDKMREGSGVFIASPIFDEGVDIPALDCVIIAAGGKSNIKLLQRIGRGMRKKENANSLQVYDFIDDTNKYLLSQSESRIDVYDKEGFETQII